MSASGVERPASAVRSGELRMERRIDRGMIDFMNRVN